MKTFGIVLLSLAISACASKVKEQKFVNPIFYKVMNPLSTGSWYTQITPTEMVRSNKGTVLKQKCTLIENTMNAVTLQCEGAYNTESVLQYRFTPDWDEKNYNGIFVWMTYKKPGIDLFPSTMSLIIPFND